MSDFSDIKNRNDFFKLLNIPKKNMTYLLYNKEKKGTENSYRTFEIEKKSGGVRVIHAPNDELKFVQKRLASLLWATQKKIWRENDIHPNISHAFEEKKSIITNAKIHRNKKFVLNLDLEDFFDSFHFGWVKGFFEKDRDFKVPKEVALIIAQLTCFQGVLPQGSPSSPIITNLICKILDFRILKLAKRYKLDYTRYADDLTFSTNNSSFLYENEVFLAKIEKEIEQAGFTLNAKKTRLQISNSRQEVTGLTVNRKINVPKEYYKNTRAMAHNLYKNGEFLIDGEQGTINKLEGRFAFINQLDKWNNRLEHNLSLNENNIEYQKYLLSIKRKENDSHRMLFLLNSREREYQKFIYYKYFYGNEQATIVTEGKTDIRYLKAALKRMYKDYPNLVEKKGKKYTFKVTFLKRSKRLKYLFNFSLDGADSIKNLYNFFSSKVDKKCPNYLKYFLSLDPSGPKNPSFFIFDNEFPSGKKQKPLKNFMNYVYSGGIKDEKIEELKEELLLEIEKDLFILTNPLINNSSENEMEDLFDEKVLLHEIGGKTFSKDGDSKKHYGKEIFSKYILENYDKIDFKNFIPILNNLNKTIVNHHKE